MNEAKAVAVESGEVCHLCDRNENEASLFYCTKCNVSCCEETDACLSLCRCDLKARGAELAMFMRLRGAIERSTIDMVQDKTGVRI